MCVEVFVNGEMIETRRQLHAAFGADIVNFSDHEWPEHMGDVGDFCLCGVDLLATEKSAGFDVTDSPWGVLELTKRAIEGM